MRRHDLLASVSPRDSLQFLASMIRIQSYSGTSGESELARFMVEAMRRLGLEAFEQRVEGDRVNAIGRWRGTGGGRSLMFNGHLDTNPVTEGWTVDPLAGLHDERFVQARGGGRRAGRRRRGRHLGLLGAAAEAGVGPTARCLQVLEEAVVRSVGADPEPDNLVVVQKPQRAVSQGYANGEDRISLVDILELKARVVGIFTEEPVRLAGGFPDLNREIAIRRPEARRRARFHSLSGSSSVAVPATRSARASAASLLRASWEVANWRAHSSSSSNSSSSQWAMRSCSSGGSLASFATAASSARVIPCSIPFFVQAGGPVGYGVNLPDKFRQTARYVGKILGGAKAADLPVEQPTKLELVINDKTAQALGLTIPPEVLVRADEVIR
jgi:hypothetical protein